MELNLKGRTALITGASKGIGRSVAEALAAEGCNLHLAARTEDDLKTAAGELADQHAVTVAIHPLDLSVSANVRALAAACDGIDILVNCAGAIPAGDIADIDEARWREAWDLKVFGYVNLTREVYAAMKPKGGGVIINIIGTGGERPSFDYVAGGMANAGLMAFSQAMGSTSIDEGIRVIAVNPGPVATDRLITLMRTRAEKTLGDAERWPELTAQNPMGRAAEPTEIAAMVAFLASERASYISGTIVTIDGGLSRR